MRHSNGRPRPTLVALLVASLAASFGPSPLAAQRGEPEPVTGRVVDDRGLALGGVRVVADDGQVVETDDDGRFTLRPRACGPLRLTVRRPGAVSVTRTVDPCAATREVVSIALRPLATRLDTVQVRARVSGVIGTVTDRAGVPQPGVEVALLGAAAPVRTDSAGRFAILDVRPGAYLLRARDPRFVAQQISVGLQQGDVRELLLLMWPLPETGSAGDRRNASGFGIDEWWYRDLGRRRAWSGTNAAIVSREELLATGERDVSCALSRVARVQQRFLRLTSGTCADWTPAQGCVIVDGRWDYPMPLWSVRTRDVELVELYQPGSDFSASTVARARQCPNGQVVAVVWSH